MKQNKHSILLLLALAAAACNENPTKSTSQRIDGSSDRTFCESVDAVKARLSAAEKRLFEKGVMDIVSSDITDRDQDEFLMITLADPDGARRRLRDKLDGMTAREVIRGETAENEITEKRASRTRATTLRIESRPMSQRPSLHSRI